jgi:site-specific recombinase XerD
MHLKEQGLRTNTRRRKILTVTQFLNYLAKRKKLAPEMARKVPAPHKVERIPFTVSSRRLVEEIRGLGQETLLDARNRCLLWTLAETGCLVSEVADLRYEQWEEPKSGSEMGQGYLHLSGKFERSVPVSADLVQAVSDLKLRSGAEAGSQIFLGFNKFGPLGTSAISPRGVELLVKHYGPRLGFPGLTPRTFRHSVILRWFEEGVAQAVIQSRLGLKTTYAFRSYVPLLKPGIRGRVSVGSTVGSGMEPEEIRE